MSDFFTEVNSAQAVTPVFQISCLQKQIPYFQDYASLEPEHAELNTDFINRL